MTLRFGLKEPTIEKIKGVFSKYAQIEKVMLYGSRAKGNYKNGSDIDLCLYGDENLNTKILYKVLRDIDDLFLPYSFDISIFLELSNPDFIEHIERVGLVFYERVEKA